MLLHLERQKGSGQLGKLARVMGGGKFLGPMRFCRGQIVKLKAKRCQASASFIFRLAGLEQATNSQLPSPLVPQNPGWSSDSDAAGEASPGGLTQV